MGRRARTYQLTQELVAQHGAGRPLCLALQGEGKRYELHAERPGAELNEVIEFNSAEQVESHTGPVVVRVDVRGPIDQRAHYNDSGCGGGWTDGHDAIAERMIEALHTGDVIMVIDSPGGMHAGLEEAIRRVQRVKAELDRRVYAYADEMIGSAAYWWAASVADELFVPGSGVVGSIGARAYHVSIAEHLAKEGVEFTYFAWPGEGKVAYAQEKPLSDIGRERGQRDVAMCGESFANAVAEARELSLDAIVALDADMLVGQLGVDAGLADEVASLDDVIDHALAIASGEESSMGLKKKNQAEGEPQQPEESTDTKAEGDEPEPEGEGDDEPEPEHSAEDEPDPEEEDDEPDEDAEGDEPEGEEEDDEPMPSNKNRTKASARRPRSSASIAELVGLPASSSSLAVKNAVRRVVSTLDAVMAEVGADGHDQVVGEVKAIAGDARRLAEVEAKNRKLVKEQRASKRLELAKKLAAASLPGLTRGDIFVDKVNDVTGKVTTKLAPEWQNMKLETFESFVNRKLKNSGAPVRRSTPFDPDGVAAKEQSSAPSLEAAKRNPIVQRAAQRAGADADLYARAYAHQFPNDPVAGDPGI